MYKGEYTALFPIAPSLAGTKALIFVNDELIGQVLVEETDSFYDQWAGGTTVGIGKIYVYEEKIKLVPEKIIGKLKWNSWYSAGSFLLGVDRLIRKYLGED